MMPGVVAGFPRPGEVIGELVSARSDTYYGFATTGASGIGVDLGSIAPPGFNIAPAAPAVVGGAGEIIDLVWDGHNQFVYLTVRGSYASADAVPFASITVNGRTFSKAAALDLGDWWGGRTLRWNSSTNPFPVGRHAITLA